MSREMVDVHDLVLVHSTNMAYLVRDKDGEQYWIPKSQVDHIGFGANSKDNEGNTIVEITCLTIPEWLAEEKGFV